MTTIPEGIPVVDALCRILEDGKFGTFNAIKKMLLANTDSGAVFKSKPKPDKKKKEKKKTEHGKQGKLF